MVDQIVEWLAPYVTINPIALGHLLSTFLIVVLLLVGRMLLRRLLYRRPLSRESRYRWHKIIDYGVYVLGLILLSQVWLNRTQGLATYLGLLTAGLAVALQDPITNLVGWLFIMWRRPFEVGDRIEVGEVAGDVVDVSLFQFTLMEVRNWVAADQSTGRIVHLPNRFVFSHSLGNFTQGLPFIWHEIPIEVTFESNWEKAKELLQEIVERLTIETVEQARRHAADPTRRYLVTYGTLTPTVYTRVQASGVLLTIRSLCDPRQRRNFDQAIWEETLRAFAKHGDIDFAYPTQRIVHQPPAADGG